MKKNCQFKKQTAVIVIHESTTGPGHDLRDYLLDNGIEALLFIAHPLLYNPENFRNSSRYEFYEKGKLVESHTAYHWFLPEPLLYIKDLLYTVYWCLYKKYKWNMFFGIGNLNAFAGLIVKHLCRVSQVVFYAIDYVPLRFANKFINNIYHRIDKISAEKCDWTWNMSSRVIEGRNKRWKKVFSNQLVVPHGVHVSRIKRIPFNKINTNEIVYMGTLLKKQGVQLVLRALPALIKKIPEIHFIIIGKGPYEEELKRFVVILQLEKYVKFLGYMPNHAIMENRIARSAIAVALYDSNSDSDGLTYYADSGKIKTYLGAGVPVLMTGATYIADQVKNSKCGFVIEYDVDETIRILNDFLLDTGKMIQYRLNAIKFASNYDWDKIFSEAVSNSLFIVK